ncbi:16S rRNA (uracil1498-N3)-methyltransferase [Humidesulfovibrio mexicanus]|uniref:Ribosomal RNA small subunit methyltransferase E n=1 Tax=Humidesulfovibrio mexicanus TaxID=147047 RepID=A0A239D005_9BACT|nr:RsmE family RNA methyltransferase [Humidesulfovibrio mexicanus]SNS25795.1 16S rRNA (uracil1498-N3)-methyltransferase [Humidesulfovibrio mexicanus]
MARLNSYHLPPEAWPAPGVRAILDGPEARHLIGVLRARVGDTVRLFDGLGRHGLFQLAATTSKSRAELSPLSETLEPQPKRGVALALGWNKASRRDWLLEKGVELGALGFVFWQAVRSQGDMPSHPKEAWREKCVQAAKQCHAAWLPELSVLPGGVDGLLRIAADYDGCYLLYEAASPEALPEPALLASGRTLVVLGPEGGLEEREATRLAEAGFRHLSLGPRPLRWETAALSCLSLAHYALLKP